MTSTLSSLNRAVAAYTATRPRQGKYYIPTEIDDLTFMRVEAPSRPDHSLYRPSLCVSVQGGKQAAIGRAILNYSAGQYLVVGLDVPVVGRVTRASPAEPYLGLKLALDLAILFEVAQVVDIPAEMPEVELASFVGQPDARLTETLLRIVELLETPRAIPVLYPAIVRELYFRLLCGPSGPAFTRLALPNGHASRISEAIKLMKARFPAPIRIDNLADAAGMSPSTFHTHFKSVTGMTPISYYKHLRLLEARRILMNEPFESAGSVAYQVGYESPSQFSRDYVRWFGIPPGQEAAAARRSVA